MNKQKPTKEIPFSEKEEMILEWVRDGRRKTKDRIEMLEYLEKIRAENNSNG